MSSLVKRRYCKLPITKQNSVGLDNTSPECNESVVPDGSGVEIDFVAFM